MGSNQCTTVAYVVPKSIAIISLVLRQILIGLCPTDCRDGRLNVTGRSGGNSISNFFCSISFRSMSDISGFADLTTRLRTD
jgi:hypothetical protein